ncbi:MAG TPA: hypothetical protein DEF01_00635 [Gemmatimonadetes bacterium]|nr:hypothetical protein [Gemmatimonadota bacterium]|tara:strand:- start:894 stop:1544 length:651 start_codon:yes stop_codon:yes gene_type:complete
MFDELRQAFREALDNFNKELGRDQASETANTLLIEMKKEIINEKVQISGLHDQLLKTKAEVADLDENIVTAQRREELARTISDEETAGLAGDWVSKAKHQRTILLKKAGALQEELEFRSQTIDEMHSRFKEAQLKIETLSATSERTAAYESITDVEELFDDMNRMTQNMTDDQTNNPTEEMSSEEILHVGLNELSSKQPLDVDSSLDELKRRMDET